MISSGGAGHHGVEQGIPGQGGAFDAHGKLHNSLESLEITKFDVRFAGLGFFLDGHHDLESMNQGPYVIQALTFDRLAHHRRGTLRDAASLTRDFDIFHDVAVELNEDRDLITAQGIVSLG